MQQFKITNTTVKAKPKTGPDTRSNLEKIGHAVSLKDENGRPIILTANEHTIIGKIDSGILGLQRGGYIKIEAIEDITAVLKEHAFQNPKQVKTTPPKGKAIVQESGKAAGKGEDEEGEQPNFVVKAGKSGQNKQRERRSRRGSPSASGTNKKNEQG